MLVSAERLRDLDGLEFMCHLEKFCHSSKLFTSASELLSVEGLSGCEFGSGELHPLPVKLLHDRLVMQVSLYGNISVMI